MGVYRIVFGIIALILFLGVVGYFTWGFFIGQEYETKIGSYIENAYEVNTPDKMLANIEKAEQGMRNEGLVESDYGSLFFKRPDNSMEFQYEFLASVKERTIAVETWYNNTYSKNGTSTEVMGDVYEQKMDNLREFLKENGRADWIAKNAWYAKKYPFQSAMEETPCPLIIIILLLFLFGALTSDSSSDY